MLKTVWFTEQSNNERGVAMLLGGFDGLHIGHRQLLEYARESGFPVGLMTIVDGKEEDGLFTFEEREEIFKRAGVDFVFELPFSEIKNLKPNAFLDLLMKEFSPKLFVCGEDFRFGAKAAGTPKNLKELTQVSVQVISLVEKNGVKVSSSQIKKLLSEGKTEEVGLLLGHDFFLIGKVYEDRKVGRTIGFPTANIQYPQNKHRLKNGVYETRVVLDGKTYKGITNFGARPTFDDDAVLTETYLDGFEGDLYGRELKVEFVRYLRDVKKFENVDKLKEQLTKDIRQVRDQ